MDQDKGNDFLNQYVQKRFSPDFEVFEEGPDTPSFSHDISGTAAGQWQSPLEKKL